MTVNRTRPPVALNEQDGREPFTVGVTSATTVGLSPRWVHYSGVSLAARAAAEVLADMATTCTHEDQAPTLDRERLAYHVGVGRADKLTPVLDELAAIGFLTIHGGGLDPATGKRRQRRDRQGHPIPDRFAIALQPPAGYAGPATLAEADLAFASDRDAAYQAATDAGKRVRTGHLTIHRTAAGRYTLPQVSTGTRSGGQDTAAGPGFRGQGASPQVSTGTGIRDRGTAAGTGIRGRGASPQVRTGTGIGGHLQIDPEIEEIEGSIEPVPGGPAAPPATGREDHHAAEVRELVRRLPWAAWAARRNPEFRLSPVDADAVQAAICEAMASAGITLDQAAVVGQAALGEATSTPVGYVADAFRKHLPRRLRALAVEPLSASPLPLPGTPAPRVAPTAPSSGRTAAKPTADHTTTPATIAAPRWCGDCAGPGERFVDIDDTTRARCPRCHPLATAEYSSNG